MSHPGIPRENTPFFLTSGSVDITRFYLDHISITISSPPTKHGRAYYGSVCKFSFIESKRESLFTDYFESNILYFFYGRLFKNPRSYTTSKKCPEFFPRILAQKLSYSEHKFSIKGLENFRQVLILIFPNSNKLLIIHRLEPFSAKNSCFSILIGPRPLSDPRVEERRAWLDRVFATRSESPAVKVEGSSRTAIVVRIRGVWED